MGHKLGSSRHLAWAVLALACATSCGRGAPVREMPTPLDGVHKTWEEAFDEGREIHLEVPEAGPELLRIGQVLRRSDGALVIPDGRAKRVLVFAPDGKLLQELVGGEDGTFPLSILRTATLDDDDNLFLFDPDGRWITELQAPEYEASRRFQIATALASFVVLPDGSSLAFSPTEEEVFRRFDSEGKEIASAYRVDDEKLRVFHARIQTGGITRTAENEVVGIHPASYALVRMSPELDVREVLMAPDHNRWQPYPPEFPEALSPYDYTPAHDSWWDTFDHIGTIYGLDRDLVLVSVFSSRGLGDSTEFANVYRLGESARLVAAGLRVPQRGRIVGASGREVYIVRNARLGEEESLEPLALYSYRLLPEFP